MPRCRLALLCSLAVLLTAGRATTPEAGYPIFDSPSVSRLLLSGPVMALAATPDGLLLVGSNQLAAFDGHSWQQIELPTSVRVLSLGAEPSVKGRVWVGGPNTLGWIERDATGAWAYQSASALLRAAGIKEMRDVRYVFPVDGGAYFVGRTALQYWDGRRFTGWELPSTQRLFATGGGGRDILVYQTGTGVYRLTPQGPQLWRHVSDLPVKDPLVGYFPQPDGTAIAVFYNDVYRVTGAEWTRLDEASKLLPSRRAIESVQLDASTIAIGTAYGGVLLVRLDGSISLVTSGQTSLPDDNVDSLLPDTLGRIWIGTGTGLARLAAQGEASLFDQRTGLASAVVRAVRRVSGETWIVSYRRVYQLQSATGLAPAQLDRMEPIWSGIDDATGFAGDLWLGGLDGLWRIRDGQVQSVPVAVGEVRRLLTLRTHPGSLLVLGPDRVSEITLAGGLPRERLTPIKPGGVPLGAAEAPDGSWWLATDDGRVTRFEFDAATREWTERLQLDLGLPPAGRPLRRFFAVANDRLLLVREDQVLVLRSDSKGFEPCTQLAGFSVEAAATSADGTAYLALHRPVLGTASPRGLARLTAGRGDQPGALRWIPLHAPGLDQIGRVSMLNCEQRPTGEVLWVGGESTLLRLEVAALRPAAELAPVVLRRVELDQTHGATDPAGPAPHIPAGGNRIEFAFASGTMRGVDTELFFQTQLAPIETAWSAPESVARREFTGLAPGNYVFKARALDRFGRGSAPVTYAFVIEAPWYEQPWALAGWVVLLGLGTWALLRWRVRRLEAQAARLNELVNERTRELSLSNTTRAEFLDSLSHEIRRPLNGILSLTQRLEQSELTPDQRAQADLLRQGGESLLRVCDEVLNHSALDYGVVAVQEQPFQLRTLLQAAIAEGSPDQARAAVHLPDDFLDGFVGDEAKLRAIVANFLANAARHAPGAAVEIDVTCTAASPTSVDVLIEVTDHGPGVPADEQELIFRRFARGSRAKLDKVPGTGIGLATCRALARLIGGSVGVESPAESSRLPPGSGPGTTFFVRVPLRRA